MILKRHFHGLKFYSIKREIVQNERKKIQPNKRHEMNCLFHIAKCVTFSILIAICLFFSLFRLTLPHLLYHLNRMLI